MLDDPKTVNIDAEAYLDYWAAQVAQNQNLNHGNGSASEQLAYEIVINTHHILGSIGTGKSGLLAGKSLADFFAAEKINGQSEFEISLGDRFDQPNTNCDAFSDAARAVVLDVALAPCGKLTASQQDFHERLVDQLDVDFKEKGGKSNIVRTADRPAQDPMAAARDFCRR